MMRYRNGSQFINCRDNVVNGSESRRSCRGAGGWMDERIQVSSKQQQMRPQSRLDTVDDRSVRAKKKDVHKIKWRVTGAINFSQLTKKVSSMISLVGLVGGAKLSYRPRAIRRTWPSSASDDG
jgi:hypothetical protein